MNRKHGRGRVHSRLATAARCILVVCGMAGLWGCAQPQAGGPIATRTAPPVEAQPTEAPATQPAGGMPAASLTTPELIDRALAQGEISADERWMYLLYAVYEYEALPEPYRSPRRWDGTLIVRELNALAGDAERLCKLDEEVRAAFIRLIPTDVACQE